MFLGITHVPSLGDDKAQIDFYCIERVIFFVFFPSFCRRLFLTAFLLISYPILKTTCDKLMNKFTCYRKWLFSSYQLIRKKSHEKLIVHGKLVVPLYRDRTLLEFFQSKTEKKPEGNSYKKAAHP
jgi:hypothetical protein